MFVEVALSPHIIIINMIKLSLDFHVIKEHTYLFLKNSFGYMNYV